MEIELEQTRFAADAISSAPSPPTAVSCDAIAVRLAREMRDPLAHVSVLKELVRSCDWRAAPTQDANWQHAAALSRFLRQCRDHLELTTDPLGFKAGLVDLADVAVAAARLNWPIAEARDVTLECATRPPGVVSGDMRLLGEAVDAMIATLVRHAPAGTIVSCMTSSTDREMAVRITSRHSALRTSDLARALDPWRDRGFAARRAAAIAGIGLWQARLVAMRHDGVIMPVAMEPQGSIGLELRLPSRWSRQMPSRLNHANSP
jgi:K+-sensing histidine kinase KdpD